MKKYKYPEENHDSGGVNEPMAEYNSFSQRKADFIRIVDKMTHTEFERLEAIYYADKYQTEIFTSVEQIKEQAKRAIEDVRTGRTVSHEELKKRFH